MAITNSLASGRLEAYWAGASFIRMYEVTAVKEKIIGAVTVMTDSDAEIFWNFTRKKYAPVLKNMVK